MAGSDLTMQAAMARFGTELGYAFQLVDDALDYGGSSMTLGKKVGDDFREGKVTLPVILAVKAAGEADRAFWSRCIEAGDIRDGDLERAIELLRKTGAIQSTVERARGYGDRAIAALDGVPPSPQRQALVEVVAFCVSRVS